MLGTLPIRPLHVKLIFIDLGFYFDSLGACRFGLDGCRSGWHGSLFRERSTRDERLDTACGYILRGFEFFWDFGKAFPRLSVILQRNAASCLFRSRWDFQEELLRLMSASKLRSSFRTLLVLSRNMTRGNSEAIFQHWRMTNCNLPRICASSCWTHVIQHVLGNSSLNKGFYTDTTVVSHLLYLKCLRNDFEFPA